MTKKQIQARRQRNAELGRIDRANRCPVCKTPLAGPTVRRVEGGELIRYCSEACADEPALQAAAKVKKPTRYGR